MATKRLTDEVLLKLRARMVKHAVQNYHPHPEDIASEYVCRLLEGLHQRSTIGQAFIDIMRKSTGRKSASTEETYKARQALTMVATSEEQEKFYSNQPALDRISIDDRMDLERKLNTIKCTRTTFIFRQLLMGYTQEEIADSLGLTLGRINQIVNRTIQDLIWTIFSNRPSS